MADVTIYHNPRCSTSRAALQAADELGVDVEVVRYLQTPPDATTLREIVAKLEDPVADLVRRDGWSDLGITGGDVSTADGVIDVLVRHPELLQRPLLVTAGTAIIGRPPARARALLSS